jgi:hypothetical protein
MLLQSDAYPVDAALKIDASRRIECRARKTGPRASLRRM